MTIETTPAPSVMTRNYSNHVITLDPVQWTFTVTGPEFDEAKYAITFNSWRDATAEITKRVEDSAKLSAQNVRLDVTVIDGKGNTISVTKINRNAGALIDTDGHYVFPNVPWVIAAV